MDFAKLRTLANRRGDLLAESRRIIDGAEKEKRAYTTEERATLDRNLPEVQRLALEMEEMKAYEPLLNRQSGREDVNVAEHRIDVHPRNFLTREQRFQDWVRDQGHEDREIARVGLGGFLRALVTGPRNEVEKRALSTAGTAGGYTVPEVLLGQLIDRMRNRTVAFQAGALTVPLTTNNTSVARLETDPVAGWHAENSTVSETEPTFGAVVFQPKTLLCLVRASRELIEDSANIEQALEYAFAGALSVELDRAVLFGSGAPPQPTGVFSAVGINSVSMGTNGAAMTSYDNLVDLLAALKVANAPEPTALVMAPRTWATLTKFKEATTNAPLAAPAAVAQIRQFVSNQVPITQTQGSAGNASCILAGDFRELAIGIRNDVTVQLLRERYADNYQFGFLAAMRADSVALHGAAFGKLIGIIP